MTTPNQPYQAARGPHNEQLVHILGDLFLTVLMTNPAKYIWQALKTNEYKVSDELCKAITSTSYIDYMRPQFDENEEFFQQLEDAAATAEEFHAVENFPYAIILLLSLGRKQLSLDTQLYALGRKSYEYYRGLSESRTIKEKKERRRVHEIALETGIQLYRREGDIEKEENMWSYLQFEFDYQEALLTRRMQFYQTDDLRRLFKLTTDRWIDVPEKAGKYQTLKKEYLEDYGAMYPQLLDLPVPYDSADALHVAEQISDVIRSDKSDTEKASIVQKQLNRDRLAKNLRIMQWEIFTRDLLDEQVERKLSYKSSLADKNIQGFPPTQFIKEVARKGWESHCDYFPLHSGILRAREPAGERCGEVPVTDQLGEYRNGFELLLNKARKYNPTSYDDVIEAFAYRDERKFISKALLVEDGEMTFFIMLWLLRQAVASNQDPGEWIKNPAAKLTVGFLPSQVEELNSWWSKKDLATFMQACGLLVPSHRNTYILTRRWRSLICWLRRQRKEVANDVDNSVDGTLDIPPTLPVKKIEAARKPGSPEQEFVAALQEFFTSDGLREYLSAAKVFPDEVSIESFAEERIGPLVRLAHCILHTRRSDSSEIDDSDEPWPDRDTVIFRMSRAGFLPLEYLFRAYQPYELHLLILALSFTKTDLVSQRSAPISLAFASIAGALPPLVPSGMFYDGTRGDTQPLTNGEADTHSSKARQWLAPYWTLFTALAAELSVGKVHKASKQIGVEEILNAFSHEVGKVEAYIYNNLFLRLGDVFSIPGDNATEEDSPLGLKCKWEEPAGVIKPDEGGLIDPDALAREMANWRVCPTPAMLASLYKLYSIWMGSKVSLKDFNINPVGKFPDLLEQLAGMAKEMAVARQRVDEINPIRSADIARLTEEITSERLHAAAEVNYIIDDSAAELRLNRDTDNFDPQRKIFLVRALLAGLSNAIQHVTGGGKVTVFVRVKDDSEVVVEIKNPGIAGGNYPQKDEENASRLLVKTKFAFGSEAVMKACAKQLEGDASINESKTGEYYISSLSFPLPKFEGKTRPWITAKAN